MSQLTSYVQKEDFDIDASIDKWNEESKSVNVFITGKTGTGKSTLVNGILGEKVAVEGETLDPQTTEVKVCSRRIGTVMVNVWDSPGLQDGTEFEEKYKKNIKENCKDVDLFLYCVNMSQTRFVRGGPDVKAMCELTELLGTKMWENTLFVMTFANDAVAMLEDQGKEGGALLSAFAGKIKMWNDKIHKVLIDEVKLPKDIAEKVVTVPAGHWSKAKLLDAGDYWLTKLWLQAVSVSKSSAQPALIKINEHRFKEVLEVDHKKMFEEQLYKQPLIFQDTEIAQDLGLGGNARILGFLKGIKKIRKKILLAIKCAKGEFHLFVDDSAK